MQDSSAEAEVTVHVLRGARWELLPTGTQDISALIDGPVLVWVDILGDPTAIENVLRQITGHRQALHRVDPKLAADGGAEPPRQPPKAKAFRNAMFARAYWMGTEETEGASVAAQEVHVLAGHTFAITMRYFRQGWDRNGTALGVGHPALPAGRFDLQLARSDVVELRERTNREDGDDTFGLEVAASVLDQVVDSALRLLNVLRERVDTMEEQVVEGRWLNRRDKGSATLPERTLGMRRLLRHVRWAFLPSDEISELLAGPFIDVEDPELRLRINDLGREADRAVDMVRDVLDQLQQTVELSNTMKADRLNDTLYLLTIVATVLLVPTLVAGIFGMNFVHLPGAGLKIGFWGSLVGMVLLGAGVWFAIRWYLNHVYLRRVSGDPGRGNVRTPGEEGR